MRSYIEVIKNWEAFIKAFPNGTMEEFGQWLIQQASNNKVEESSPVYQTSKPLAQGNLAPRSNHPADSHALHLLWRLHKILKVYRKPIFDTEGLKSQDEFAILAYIHEVGECTKKEAVETHFIDRSTGIDMIKRLIKRGVLTDRVSPKDRRARLVQLSPEGEALLHRIYSRLMEIPEVLVNMTNLEKEAFIQQLQKMEEVHTKNISSDSFKNKT